MNSDINFGTNWSFSVMLMIKLSMNQNYKTIRYTLVICLYLSLSTWESRVLEYYLLFIIYYDQNKITVYAFNLYLRI